MARSVPNPTWKQKYAGALLRIKNADGSWLIPEPLRSTGTTEQVIAITQVDHQPPVIFGGTNRPQDLFPMVIAPHQEKSKVDNRNAKKSTRLEKKEAEHRAKIEGVRQAVLATEVRIKQKKKKPKYDWKAGRYLRDEDQ